MKSMMISPTYGKVGIERMAEIVSEYIAKDRYADYEISIGTDSQNYNKTKIVLVLAVRKIGSGGIFFYCIEYIKRINNIREKLIKETQMSLELADSFLKVMDERFYNGKFDYTKHNIYYIIHIDAGHNGKTNVLIPELVGWVTACGYDATVKPESFAASSIANKYSK